MSSNLPTDPKLNPSWNPSSVPF